MISKNFSVILASASPRRQDLLKELISEFQVVTAGIDEDALTDPDPFVTAQRLAKEKVFAVYAQYPDSLVIGGDTVVALPTKDGWQQLSKPVDEADAARILSELSGKTHTVITGICMKWPNGFHAFTESSEVTFKPMSREEIQAYIATGEPMDKAGAYGLQGGARPFISEVKGSINNVIGLPTERLKEALREI